MFLARKYSIPCQRVRTILAERVPGYHWRRPNEQIRPAFYDEWADDWANW
jgi:hypothetical protein